MAKNRKTRKEKIRASHRLTAPSSSVTSENSEPTLENRETFSFTSDSYASVSTQKASQSTLSTHLREDLLRTGIVTGAIILAELILYYTLSLR